MAVSLKDLVSFFVDFEQSLSISAPPDVMNSTPRDALRLLEQFESYSNCTLAPLEVDLSEGLKTSSLHDELYSKNYSRILVSQVLNFGTHAEIYINSALKPDGKPIVNYCHKRFFLIKEAFHVILRDYFIRMGAGHPDTASPEQLLSIIEQMIYLPLSINDLDNPAYSESERLEHGAELLALFMLYPLDRIAADRKSFLKTVGAASYDDPRAGMADTFGYADTFKVPQRYVDLMFRWSKFEYLYDMYKDFRRKVYRL